MRTLDTATNITATIFYFFLHVFCIGSAIINLYTDNMTTAVIFAVAAIVSYKPYRSAATRAQQSLKV